MRPSLRQCLQPVYFGSRLFARPIIPPISPFKRMASTSTPAIARSIREAVQKGEVHRGYRIFTQTHAQDSIQAKLSALNSTRSRFLAHVFLHALHRSPNSSLAPTFAKGCLANGIKIRHSTFNIVLSGLFRLPDANVVFNGPAPQLSSSINNALSLFNAARRSGHEHSTWMFDRFISNLLLHGEVLTAALLFVAIVKEWNASKQMKPVIAQAANEEKMSTPKGASAISQASFIPGSMLKHGDPLLHAQWMHNIVNTIERGYDSKDTQGSQRAQALSVLVDLLEGPYHFIPAKWRLLKVMYSIPPELVQDKAEYERWHQILLGLCSQPTKRRHLDIQSYNVLLLYALQERMSMELAINVVKSLCQSYKPTPMTYNILIRELVRLNEQPSAHAVKHLLYPTLLPIKNTTSPASRSSPLCEELIRELRKHPAPLPDEFSLIASMSQAIASGHPLDACKVVTDLFPTLEKPKWGARNILGGRYVTSRARKMSPHFWGTAVHAAAEASHLPLSMRIWRLLGRAEQGRNSIVSLYSLEAYTSHFELLSAKIWRVYKRTRSISAHRPTQDEERVIWLQFIKYNHLLLAIRQVLKSLRNRWIKGEPRLEVDQRLATVVLSLVRCVHIIQQYLPQLAYNVAKPHQRQQFFGNNISQRRAMSIIAIVRTMFAEYGSLAPRQLRNLGWFKSADGPLPALRPPKRPIPFTMRQFGTVRKTRFGFKVSYSGRMHRFWDAQVNSRVPRRHIFERLPPSEDGEVL